MTNATEPDEMTLMTQRARQEWDERIGSAVSAAKNWRMACFVAMTIAAGAVIGMAYIGAQSKIQPYVLNLGGDKAQLLPPLSNLSNTQLALQYQKDIADFVQASRNVYIDVAAQKLAVITAYSYLMPSTPAYSQLTQKYKAQSPFARAESELVKAEVTTILPLSDNTWQVEWKETISNRTGDVLSVKHYKATLNTVVIPPVSHQAAAANPLGFYIKTFNDVEVH